MNEDAGQSRSRAPRLAGEDIVFARGRRRVLDGASLALGDAELVALLGANGSGKTTLLRILLGLATPKTGVVTLDRAPLAGLHRRVVAQTVAYVPQSHHAPFPYLVRDIVGMGRAPATGLFGRPRARDAEAVAKALALLEISHLAERAYTTLSGGERQLALIARALAQGASLLVLDEPTNGLDYGHQLRLLRHLRRLTDSGFGVLMTTHHPDQARCAATRVATLVDGRIECDGAPHTIITPETLERLYGEMAPVFRTGG